MNSISPLWALLAWCPLQRVGYHPATLLKLYRYGYLNQVASSRRFERGAGRNVEVIWLTGRLAPDLKAVADFQGDNGPAIHATWAQFVVLCRQFGRVVGLDGSRFKAGNTRDKNFTPGAIQGRIEQVEPGIARYLAALDTADCREDEVARCAPHASRGGWTHCDRMRELQAMATAVEVASGRQISLTGPDARAMATKGKGTGLVGYNVQAAVDTKHHPGVAHAVTNVGHDRTQLAPMSCGTLTRCARVGRPSSTCLERSRAGWGRPTSGYAD